jgi:hypothetical protein
MKSVNELLRDADPVRREPAHPANQRNSRRQSILAAASAAPATAGAKPQSRLTVAALVAAMLILASLFALSLWSPLIRNVQAAVRFEITLAEEKPAPGLHEAKLAGSGRSIYLHDDPIVTNSDIAVSRVIPGNTPSQYWVSVDFNAAGSEKMRAATANHIGKPIAILIDGQVVLAPALRTPISTSARVSGNFTKAQAERIVNGIAVK